MLDLIVQFYFQLVRGNNVENQLIFLLENIKNNESKYSFEMCLLYKLIGQTRDIFLGKGECTLSYMQLFHWYNYYPTLALYAFNTFIYQAQQKAFGSWKDVKYMCQYIYNKTLDKNHPFINALCFLMTERLKVDFYRERSLPYSSPSFAAKWAPREKGKFKWLFQKMAILTYNFSPKKSFTHFRKLISHLNRKLDTTEIKMCEQKWDAINNVSSKCLMKYQNSFIKHGVIPQNYNSKRCEIGNLVKNAIFNTSDIVNLQWENFKPKIIYQNVIPILDASILSCQKNLKPLFTMIGMGIFISECSKGHFKNKIFLSGMNDWIRLNSNMTFREKVLYIYNKIIPIDNNICNCLKYLHEYIVYEKLPVKKLKLVIFSTKFDYMNIPLDRCIESLFSDLPKFYFINLGKGIHNPMNLKKNFSFLSGYNISMLFFLKEGSSNNKIVFPFQVLYKKLSHERYTILGNIFINFLNNKI